MLQTDNFAFLLYEHCLNRLYTPFDMYLHHKSFVVYKESIEICCLLSASLWFYCESLVC